MAYKDVNRMFINFKLNQIIAIKNILIYIISIYNFNFVLSKQFVTYAHYANVA